MMRASGSSTVRRFNAKAAVVLAALALLVCRTSAATSEGMVARSALDQPEAADSQEPESLLSPLALEEQAEPFNPRTPLGESDRDRLQALKLFAMARLKQQRDDEAGALRLYERVARYDPLALPAWREITALALSLGRADEAARYALKSIERQEFDPLLLRRLGRFLTVQGEFDKALVFYEKALELEAGHKQTSRYLALAFQTGKLYFAKGDHQKAYERLAAVAEALEDPGRYGLDDDTHRELLKDASKTFETFVNSDVASAGSDETNAHRLIAEVALDAGKHDQAQAAFDKAHELSSNDALHAFDQARVHFARGELDEAARTLQTYLDAKETQWGSRPYELLSEILDQAGRQDELIAQLEKLYSEQADNISLGYFLAERYHQAERLEEAEKLSAELILERPSLSGYRALLDIYRRTDQPEKLLKLLGQVLGTLTLQLLGDETVEPLTAAETLKRLTETARRLQAQRPEGLDATERRAVALIALAGSQYEWAAEFFQLAIEAEPEGATALYLRWGLGALIDGANDEAVSVFRRALQSGTVPEDDPEINFHLAAALELSGQTDDALQSARRADEAADKQADRLGAAYFRIKSRLPWVLYHAKRYDEAADAYQALVEKVDPIYSHRTARTVAREARMVLSNICVLKDNIAQAEEWLEQVLDEFPDEIGALNDLGYLWSDQNKHLNRSLAMIQQAVAGDPDNPAYRDSLGWIFYKLGRHDEAVAELKKAAQVEEPDGIILDHLGDALLASGQVNDAVEVWTRAAAALEKQDEAEKLQAAKKKIEEHRQP